MNRLTEDVRDEIEVLRSIYADSFKRTFRTRFIAVVSVDPVILQIAAIGEEGVTLTFTLEHSYPESIPRIRSDFKRGDADRLMHHLLGEAEKMRSTAMIFGLATECQEWLQANKEQAEPEFVATIIEDRKLDTQGTPVTVESFTNWLVDFVKARSVDQDRKSEADQKALTGSEYA